MAAQTKKMVIIALLVICGALLYIFSQNSGDAGRGTSREGAGAPELTVSDSLSGRKIPASEFAGKVLFINFWASWCAPCKEEMPSIEALFREMSLSDNFRMVTVLYKDSPSTAHEYLKSMGFTFPVYLDADGKTAKKYGVTGVPETYIVDKKGNLVKKIIGGFDWNSPEAKGFIQKLLAQ